MIRRNPRRRRPSWLDFFDDCRKTRRQLEEEERQRQARSHQGISYIGYAAPVAPIFPPPPPVAAEGCCCPWSGDYKDRCCSIWDSRQAGAFVPMLPESLTVTCDRAQDWLIKQLLLGSKTPLCRNAPFRCSPTLQGTP